METIESPKTVPARKGRGMKAASSLPAVPVVETKEKRGLGRQTKTPVQASIEETVEAQEAAPAKRGHGKKAEVRVISKVETEEEAVEEVKKTKGKGKKANALSKKLVEEEEEKSAVPQEASAPAEEVIETIESPKTVPARKGRGMKAASSLPAVPVVETKEKRGLGRQTKTPVQASIEETVEAQEAAPAKRGHGKKAEVRVISKVETEEEAVEKVKESKAKGKKGVAEVDCINLTTVGSLILPMAGPSASGGDAASIDDQSTEADTTGQRTRSVNKNIVDAFEDIRAMADSLVLPKSIIDKASDIFKDVIDGKYLKGHGYHEIAAACLLIACRKEGHSRTFKEMSAVTKLTKKEIGRCFNLIRHALDISVVIIKISDFLPRFCLHLGLPIEVQMTASHIGRKAMDLDIVPGRCPISVAAGAIYMASHASDSEEKLTKKEIGDIAGCADVTIRQTYELMYPHAKGLFPADFKLILSQLPLR